MKFHLLKQAVIGPSVPMAVFENLYNAKDNDLKVILYALHKNTADPMEISKNLQITMAAVQSSLLFWSDKGLIMAEFETEEKPKKKKLLSAQEILEISEQHPEISVMVNQLQQIYGQAINERGTNAFINLYIQDNVPVEVILVLSMYYAPIQKGPAYTAKVILNLFQKNGITSAEKADEHIRLMEKRDQTYIDVCAIFSLEKNKLTTSEKTIIDSWYERLEMTNEMVKAAYTAAGHNATIRYCNGILKSWSQKGYHTEKDIQEDFAFAKSERRNIEPEEDIILQDMNVIPIFEKGE